MCHRVLHISCYIMMIAHAMCAVPCPCVAPRPRPAASRQHPAQRRDESREPKARPRRLNTQDDKTQDIYYI